MTTVLVTQTAGCPCHPGSPSGRDPSLCPLPLSPPLPPSPGPPASLCPSCLCLFCLVWVSESLCSPSSAAGWELVLAVSRLPSLHLIPRGGAGFWGKPPGCEGDLCPVGVHALAQSWGAAPLGPENLCVCMSVRVCAWSRETLGPFWGECWPVGNQGRTLTLTPPELRSLWAVVGGCYVTLLFLIRVR